MSQYALRETNYNIPSNITNLSNKIKKYDENLIYYTSLAKCTRNFKTIITSEVIQYNIQIHKNIIYKFHKNNNDKTLVKAFPS